jgi:prevent-host-death family protein
MLRQAELCHHPGTTECVGVCYNGEVGRLGCILLPLMARIAILAVMKSVTALEAKNRFGEVLEAAQRQPVSITRNGRPSVVMISAESYARRQRMARVRLRNAMQHAGEHAAAQGMNEGVLDQLLADES